MEQSTEGAFSFRVGEISCLLQVIPSGREVLLHGNEAENGKTTFHLVLSFPSEQANAVDEFARNLAQTKTLPRMMAELAEDYLPFF
ncbi:MAG: hypothetical protein IKD18_05520 [Clostridia bacterium]|nr:hypothetical protein [Clostridia bacterium]